MQLRAVSSVIAVCVLHLLCPVVQFLQCLVFISQRDHLKIAQQFFQLVGGSASECGMFFNFSDINGCITTQCSFC